MNKFTKRTLAAAIAAPLFGLCVGSAVAQTSPSTMPADSAARAGAWSAESFQRLDTNRDGMLSRDEAKADPTVFDAWSKIDAQNSGRISKDSFERYRTTQDVSSPNRTGTGTGNTQK